MLIGFLLGLELLGEQRLDTVDADGDGAGRMPVTSPISAALRSSR